VAKSTQCGLRFAAIKKLNGKIVKMRLETFLFASFIFSTACVAPCYAEDDGLCIHFCKVDKNECRKDANVSKPEEATSLNYPQDAGRPSPDYVSRKLAENESDGARDLEASRIRFEKVQACDTKYRQCSKACSPAEQSK
jgi:hypothetical protein